MEKTLAAIDELIRAVGTLAEQPDVQALIEVVSQQQQQIEAQQQQIEKLKDEPSQAETPEFAQQFGATEPRPAEENESQKSQETGEKARTEIRPSRQHPQWFWPGQSDHAPEPRDLSSVWPGCGVVEQAPLKVQQVAELVEQPIEIWEYQRPQYRCDECGWSGYAPLPWGVK